MNPLKKIMERRIAEAGSQNEKEATESSLSLVFRDDIKTLKSIEGTPKKVQFKKDRIDHYLPFVNGVIDSDDGRDSVIVSYMLVWAMDVGNYAEVEKIASYMLKHGLGFPDSLMRASVSTFIARELVAHAPTGSISDDEILSLFGLLVYEPNDISSLRDMADAVRKELLVLIARTVRKTMWEGEPNYEEVNGLYAAAIASGASIKGEYRDFAKEVGEKLKEKADESKDLALYKNALDYLKVAEEQGASLKKIIDEVDSAIAELSKS